MKEYTIKSEDGKVVYFANSKRGLVGILTTIIDNNLIDLKKNCIEIWQTSELEKASGIKLTKGDQEKTIKK